MEGSKGSVFIQVQKSAVDPSKTGHYYNNYGHDIFRHNNNNNNNNNNTSFPIPIQKSKPIQIITQEEKESQLKRISSFESMQLQTNVNQEYFEPFNNSPPNDFLNKLYKRFQIYSEQNQVLSSSV